MLLISLHFTYVNFRELHPIKSLILFLIHSFGKLYIYILIHNTMTLKGNIKRSAITLTACLVVNPITVGNFAFLFNCTPVGRTSDSMMFIMVTMLILRRVPS